MKELEIELNGRVQGIGFRQMILSWAKKNNLRGYVTNRDDGSVYLLVQSENGALQKFLNWLSASPGLSNIQSLRYTWRESISKYEGFSINRKGNFLKEQFKNFVNLGKSFFKSSGVVPVHVAIIPDGNRRWAKERGLNSEMGHYKAGSITNIKSLINESKSLGIKYMSIWGFSTENWKRSKKELEAIFKLVNDTLLALMEDAKINHMRFKHVGRKDRLPKYLIKTLNEAERFTKNNAGIMLSLCLDYGGRDEIVKAVNDIIKSGKKKINEQELRKYLYTQDLPDPDLIIRTSGEKRISGFMPFQSVYSELYFTDKYFPEFSASDLRKAVEEFGRRQRRFGGS